VKRETHAWINLLCPALWQMVSQPNLYTHTHKNIFVSGPEKPVRPHCCDTLKGSSTFFGNRLIFFLISENRLNGFENGKTQLLSCKMSLFPSSKLISLKFSLYAGSIFLFCFLVPVSSAFSLNHPLIQPQD